MKSYLHQGVWASVLVCASLVVGVSCGSDDGKKANRDEDAGGQGGAGAPSSAGSPTAEGVLPHGHYLLREMTLTATTPDGRILRMLDLDDWDINWQGQYHFREPVRLPAGTKLEVVAVYDNSSANLNNPNPWAFVYWGDQSWNEMMLGYFEYYLVAGGAKRP